MVRTLVFLILLGNGFALAGAETDSLALDAALLNLTGPQQIEYLQQETRRLMRNDPKRALVIARRALAVSMQLSNDSASFQAFMDIGVALYYQGQYKPSLRSYENALAVAERLDNEAMIAVAHNNIGVLYFVWGEHDEALEYYLKVLTINLELDKKDGIARAYNNIAGVHHSAERYDTALEYYGQALEFYCDLGDKTFEASTLNNIGLVQHELGNYGQAMSALEDALQLESEAGDRSGESLSLNNMGMVRMAQDRPEEAGLFFTEALEIRREINDRLGESVTLQLMGDSLVTAGEVEFGIRKLEAALEISQELEVLELIRDCLLDLSEAWEKAGHYDKALEYARRHKEAHDRIFDEDRARQMAAAEARFELDLKDQEIGGLRRQAEYEEFRRKIMLTAAGLFLIIIALLWNRYRFQKRVNLEIQAKNEALGQAHSDLERAAREELAHVARVATMGELAAAFAHELNQPLAAIKTNVRAARNLRDLQDGQPDEVDEVDEALQDIGDDADRAREIIIRLREMMRKGEERREWCNINEIIGAGIKFIEPTACKQGVTIDLDLAIDLPQVRCDRIQLQQVLLNLVQNSLAAMNGSEGGITIRSRSGDEDTVDVLVIDEGPAVSPEVMADMFNPFFTTKAEGLGIGLPICRTIIEAHGGELVAWRNEERGLTVIFCLPNQP